MRLTKTEAKRLCDLYCLGNFKEVKPIKGGLENYNLDLKTDNGRFVVRVMKESLSVWRIKTLRNVFRVVNFLREKNFPYEVPEFIKTKYGRYRCRLNRKNIIVYQKIPGKSAKRINDKQFDEMAEVLAKYHKYISSFKHDKEPQTEDFKWAYEEYSKLHKIKPKTRVDKIMKKNLDFIESAFKKAMEKRINENILVVHGDITSDNVLFKNNKLIALIDFDDLEKGSRVHDIVISARSCCMKSGKLDMKKYKLFIRKYERINKLSNTEKDAILYYMLIRICIVYPWVYSYMKKDYDKRYKHLKDLYQECKNIIDNLKT